MRKTITFLKRSVGSISYLHTFNSKRGLYTFRLFAFIVAFLGFSANSAWGQSTTYTFTSNAWASDNGNWTKSGNGNQLTAGQGVQIATGQSGTVICSPTSNTNISKVEVSYCTNASSGVGNISAYYNATSSTTTGTQIGSTFSVTKASSGGQTLKTATFTPASGTPTGYVQIKIICTTNSLFIYSVTITTTTPSITTPSPTSLSGFLTTSGTASSSQTFTVGGSNLTADLVVTAPTDYEVRENSIGSFGSSVSFTPSSGTVATKTIEVRIAAAASAGTPLGNIACTSTNATTKNVAVSGTVNAASSPVITALGTINAFANTAINATSTEQSYTVEGSNLTGDIVITPPTGFQISTTSGLSFSPTNPITLAKDVSGNVSQTTIYVRFAPTAVQAYSGNITHASTDATTVNKALSGTGVYAEPTNQPVGLTAIANSSSQITVTWTDASGAQAPSAYLVKAAVNPSTPTAPVDGTAETAGTLVKIVTQGTQQAVFTGLSTSTTYNFSIWPYTNSGTAINYKTDGTVATASATTETPLGVPVATSATDVTTTSFNANWNTAASATGYDVNVYTKSIGVAQNATSILTNPGTNNVNGTATQTGADGWTYTNISSSTSYIKMVKNGTGAAPSIISPTMNLTNYATLTYDMTGGTFGTVTGGLAALNLYVSTDNGNNWSSAIAITVSGSSESGAVTDVDLSAYVGNSQVIVKLEAPNATTGAGVRAKNITLTGKQNIITSTPITDSPFTVTATSKAVSGLNPATTYYYTVVAKNANETSSASNEISVTTDNHLSVSGDVNASTLPVCPTCDIEVTTGNTLNINESKTFNSVTVAPGAKLTLNNGSTFSPGTFVLQSSGSATATFVDARSDANKTYIPATVQQYLPQGRNWYVGIPIVSGSASTLTAAGLSTSVSYWDETAGDWENNYAGTLTPGIGYIGVSTPAAGSGTNNVSFTGNLNTGNFPITVTRTVTAANKPGFNLIANPYPSYLNPCALITGKTKLEPTIWYRTAVWLGEPDNKYLYSFETVNTADGVGTNGVTGYIPPMQAFWVKVLPNANPAINNSEELIFTNAMRYHSNPTIEEETITTTPLKAKESVSKKVVRLRISNGITNDEAVLYSNANAQNSFDKFDSRKMSNDNVAIPEIFTVVDNEQLVINGYNQLPMDVEIPLGFKTGKAGKFTLRANEIKNLNENTALVVKDKVLNLEYNLTNGDAYEFNSAAANNTSRFSIIFRTAGVATSVDNSKLNTSTNVFVNANGELMVKTSAPLSADAKVSVYNAVGQLISIKPLSSGMSITNAARTAGVYWVKITNDGEMVTRKVIVN